MTRNTTTRRRAAFTLVELMVAAAVCVLIMAILTQAFVISTDTMRQLKATGDMQDQLRAAGIVLREDLSQNHFPADDSRENLGLRLSDQRLDRIQESGTVITRWSPPAGGFFRARCTPSFIEGYDNDGIGSYRVDGTLGRGHYLHFTSIRPGGLDRDLYSLTTAAGTFSSRAAELAYFLDPTPQGSTGGVTYTNLIRRQRLVAMTDQETGRFPGRDPGVSISPAALTVNTLATITDPVNRLGGRPNFRTAQPILNGTDMDMAPSPSRPGDDVLLSHVISFEVKLKWVPAVGVSPFLPRSPRPFTDPFTAATTRRPENGFDDEPIPAASLMGSASTDSPVDTLPRVSTNELFYNQNTNIGQYVFDTWSTAVPGWDVNRLPVVAGQPNQPPPSTGAIPMRTRVQQAKITIRVWDPKLKLSRQMTIVQDL